jgi:hypothetical protein
MKKNDFWSPEGLERRLIGKLAGAFVRNWWEKTAHHFFLDSCCPCGQIELPLQSDQ